MNIYDFADSLNKDIVLRRYANQKGRFTADFEHCEIMRGGCLAGTYENGSTAIEAINELTKKVSGNRIVFGAYTNERAEYNVPELELITK